MKTRIAGLTVLSIEAFARELLIWNKAKHPNILPLNGFYFDDYYLNAAWLTTPWQSRGNLLKYLDVAKPDWEDRLKLVSGFSWVIPPRRV